MSGQPILRGAYTSWQDETAGLGKRPVVLDVLGPDHETSILPDDLRMVLHVDPSSMSIQHNRQVERIQTRGGFVEQHWGDAVSTITFEQATGGFMRLYAGLSNITNPARGGTRRETIAYDKYLDMLALFHNNGEVYDSHGQVVFSGILKITFDGGVYLGKFSDLTETEAADKPYQFTLSTNFQVHKEIQTWRSTLSSSTGSPITATTSSTPQSQNVLGGF